MKRALLLTFLLAGCDLQLEAMTAPPPGATAELDADDKVITLTRGTALAVACVDGGDLCGDMKLTVGNSAIADARVAFRNALDFTWDGPQQATSFVIFARSAGRTTVEVDSDAGDVTYDVVVED